MVSIFQHPLYPYSGTKPLGPNMVNVPLSPGSGSEAFRATVTKRWMPALEAHRPQLIMISAGFDAHRDDPLANLELVDDDYAWVTRELCGVARKHGEGRIVATLEGGYALPALARSAAQHVRELMVS
jgi:acetoin utilization deacetylase AcuC-like enzyme